MFGNKIGLLLHLAELLLHFYVSNAKTNFNYQSGLISLEWFYSGTAYSEFGVPMSSGTHNLGSRCHHVHIIWVLSATTSLVTWSSINKLDPWDLCMQNVSQFCWKLYESKKGKHAIYTLWLLKIHCPKKVNIPSTANLILI